MRDRTSWSPQHDETIAPLALGRQQPENATHIPSSGTRRRLGGNRVDRARRSVTPIQVGRQRACRCDQHRMPARLWLLWVGAARIKRGASTDLRLQVFRHERGLVFIRPRRGLIEIMPLTRTPFAQSAGRLGGGQLSVKFWIQRLSGAGDGIEPATNSRKL